MLNSFQLNIVKISAITHFYKIIEEKKESDHFEENITTEKWGQNIVKSES